MIIKSIKKNKKVETIYALPGNGGIAADAECVNVGATDIAGIVDFAKNNDIGFAVVAPDDPLVLGAVDALEAKGYVFESAGLEMIPQNYITLTDEHDILMMEKLIEHLEDNDDVQNIYHNWEEA